MGQYGQGKLLVGSNLFVTTHALLIGKYVEPMTVLGGLLSVPDQHHALVMPFDHERAIDVLGPMLYITRGLFEQGTGPISPHVYWVTPNHIDVLRGDLEGERIRLHAPARFKLTLHGLVPEYLPISVPATPVPRLPQWYREGTGKPRKGRAARDRAGACCRAWRYATRSLPQFEAHTSRAARALATGLPDRDETRSGLVGCACGSWRLRGEQLPLCTSARQSPPRQQRCSGP
jgi:hypothetical protein